MDLPILIMPPNFIKKYRGVTLCTWLCPPFLQENLGGHTMYVDILLALAVF